MRLSGIVLAALALSAPAAAETVAVVRASDLKANPSIDSATVGTVAANQQVNRIGQRGSWVQVQSSGRTGWLKMFNVKAVSAGGAKPKGKGGSPMALLSGSSGKTATTGVKGMDADDIRKATPDPAQFATLSALAVSPTEATNNARQSGLRETTIDHLAKPSGK